MAYKGPAVDDGAMDVYELAPALLAVGESFQEANKELNGDQAHVAVKVRDKFEAGSFDIYLQIDHALIEQAKAIILPGNVKSAKDLAILLGFVGGMGDSHATVGVIHLLKQLKGRIIKAITPSQDGRKVDLHFEDIRDSNISIQIITTDPETLKLATNQRIRQSVNKITKPLDRQGIDKVEISDGPTVVEEITREERPYFYPIDIVEGPAVKTGNSQSSTRVAELEIVSLAFKPNNKWRFTDGNATYSVTIKDTDFLKKVEQRQITFGRGDILKVFLQQETEHTPNGLKTTYTVLEVIDSVKPPKLSS